ncbi:MAG: OmpA family protein, partial [Chitinivibrionales bacterium]|nr:OmpA family protein [Chitinivibrionales bacterium]
SFKIHLNEGIVYSLESGRDPLLLLSMALQGNVHPVIALGLEVNSRTSLNDPALQTDPLWLTPTILFRTPFHCTFQAGADIALSQDRSASPVEALEKYRIFGSVCYSVDVLAKKREAEREAIAAREQRVAKEKASLVAANQSLQSRADSLAYKARQDSLLLVAQQAENKRVADSLAQKARKDSLALDETKRHLEEEKSKRSDAEKQLLSTGLLLLDAVYFESGKTEISINSLPYLNIIGKMLSKYPKLQLEVQGHTDIIGGAAANLRLSQLRAESVRDYLIQVAPDLGSRLRARGYGMTMPKADNRTAAGRKINRRVELSVINKEELREYNR